MNTNGEEWGQYWTETEMLRASYRIEPHLTRLVGSEAGHGRDIPDYLAAAHAAAHLLIEFFRASPEIDKPL